MARDLVDEQGAGDPARLRGGRNCDVVGDDDHLDLATELLGLLRGEPEIQAIARVVLHDQQATGVTRDAEDAGQHGVHARRSEDLARDRSRQHSPAHETRMCRLMSGAAARDDGDLAPVPVLPDHHLDVWVAVEPGEVPSRGAREQAVDGLRHDRLACVEEALHGLHPLAEAVRAESVGYADPRRATQSRKVVRFCSRTARQQRR